MQRVDAILQRTKCTLGPGPTGPSTGFQGQGRSCSCWGRDIYGTLCKEVADQRGHLPAQATSTLAGCERPAWARKCRRGHDGHLKITRMAWRITTWWKRCYEGLRGARVVSPLSHIILRIFTGRCGFVVSLFCLLCWFVLCFGVGLLVFFFGMFLWKFCTQLGFISFRISSSWPTMLRARSAMQEKKWNLSRYVFGLSLFWR